MTSTEAKTRIDKLAAMKAATDKLTVVIQPAVLEQPKVVNVYFATDFAETYREGTLAKAVSDEVMRVCLANWIKAKIVLWFPIPSAAWIHANNGPHEIIMNATVPYCLTQDVLKLCCTFSVEVRTHTQDPRKLRREP